MQEGTNTTFQYQHFHSLKEEKQTNLKKEKGQMKKNICFILNSVIEMFTAVDSQPSQGTVAEYRFINSSQHADFRAEFVFSPQIMPPTKYLFSFDS